MRELRIPLRSGTDEALIGLALEAAPERSRGMWMLHLHGNAGAPSEANVQEDSEAAFQWLIDQGVPAGKTIL